MSTPGDHTRKGTAQVSPARAAAFAALRRLRSGARLDESAAALPELSALSAADRALANELVNGTVKRRRSLDAVLGAYTRAPLRDALPDVRDALRLAAFQLLFLDRVPAYAAVDDAVALVSGKNRRAGGFVNAVLRRVAAEGREKLRELGAGDDARAWSVRLSYPVWLVKLLREELGDAAAEALLEAADSTPERCLRVNQLRGGLTAARMALQAEGYSTKGFAGLPDALLYEGPPLERSPAFRDGLVTAQSRGSQIAGIVAAGGAAGPGARVLDLCAAPGAKTSQLAGLLPGAAVTGRRGRRGARSRPAGEPRAPRSRLRRSRPRRRPRTARGLGRLVRRRAAGRALQRSGHARVARRPPLAAAHQRRAAAGRAAGASPGAAPPPWSSPAARSRTPSAPSRAPRLSAWSQPLLTAGGWEADDLGAAWPGLAHPEAGGFLLVLPPEQGSSGFFIARLRRQT